MARLAYVTIDDGPTRHTAKLLTILDKKGVKATFFCRGDRLVKNRKVMIKAVQTGHVLGNHSYSHAAASAISFEEWLDDLMRAEAVIDEVYKSAKVKRPGKYYRFPYLDRGDGDKLERRLEDWNKTRLKSHLFGPVSPVDIYQRKLSALGFCHPFKSVKHPIFSFLSKMPVSDCVATFSTFDWKLTKRHSAKEGLTVEDLGKRALADYWLTKGPGRQVIIFHDDPDDLTDSTAKLLEVISDSAGVSFA